MCLYIGNKNGFVTKEEITVYKVLKKRYGVEGYCTPCQNFPVSLGEDLIPSNPEPSISSSGFKYALNGGAIHAFLDPVQARKSYSSDEIFKATIPAGTHIWIQDDLTQIASRVLKISRDTITNPTEELYHQTLTQLADQISLPVIRKDGEAIGIKVSKYVVSTKWFKDVQFCDATPLKVPKKYSYETAGKDKNGEKNTKDLLTKNPGVKFSALSLVEGGYLPSVGELKEVFMSMAELNLTRFGLGLDDIIPFAWFWTSTMKDEDKLWGLGSLGIWAIGPGSAVIDCTTGFYVLPFLSSCEGE